MKVRRFGKRKEKDKKVQLYLWYSLLLAYYCLEVAAAKAELSVRARVLICTY